MLAALPVSIEPQLPNLGWLVFLNAAGARARVGLGVRVTESAVFEGGWAYTDSPEQIRESGVYLGSGAIWTRDGLHVISPSHTCEAVYVAQHAGGVVAGNSMAAVMAAAGVSEFDHPKFSSNVWTIKRGIDSYRRKILHVGGTVVWRYCRALVRVTPEGELQELQQSDPVRVANYEGYLHFLTEVLRSVHDSSRFHKRSVPLSRGYDSVACASLAKRLGGGTAISLNLSRDLSSDSGAAIGEALGLETYSIQRVPREYVAQPVETKAEGFDRKSVLPLSEADELMDYYCGMGFLDEPLRFPSELVSESVLLSGFHGDRLWGRLPVSSDISRGDTSGSSLGEFRQRTGFVHVPVPMLAAAQHAAIRAITDSPELSPWSVDRYYDRPIPRRMAEEMGVPRHLFGRKKMAVATLTSNLETIAPVVMQAQLARAREELGLPSSPEAASSAVGVNNADSNPGIR